MRCALIAALALWPWSAMAEGESDPPLVEVERSQGLVDGQGGPSFDAVRVDLWITNRLPVDVTDLKVRVSLVSARAGGIEPIPGWRLDESFGDAVVPSEKTATLRIDRPLPLRRSAPLASEIAYRVEIDSYRIAPPSLELAARLIESSAASDQRAGLRSYERLGDLGLSVDTKREVGLEVASAIAHPPSSPDAHQALSLLIAVRAAAELNDPELVVLLLELPGRIPPERLTMAMRDLVGRMREGSEPHEPRLELVPMRSIPDELLADSTKEAIVRMGEGAIPELVRASRLAGSPSVRAQASSLLHALGRATVRSQLAIADGEARARLIEAYGDIGSPEPVAALAELVATRGPVGRAAPTAALKKIGKVAVGPLVDALGTPNKDARAALIDILDSIGPAAQPELIAAARRYGITVPSGATPRALATALAEQLALGQKSRWRAEIRHALDLARSGDYDDAFRRLDAVYAADPAVYMELGGPIAEAYLGRAQGLFSRGNYDAALETVRLGQTVRKLPELAHLATAIQIALARGYLELGELSKALETLDALEPDELGVDERAMRGKILVRQADLALEQGDYGRAKKLLERARLQKSDAGDLLALERRLALAQNAVLFSVVGLVLLGLALVAVAVLWRKVKAPSA
ncbi:MAG: hypothetical protein U1E65_15890 [Myxococcota bacterium]